ncbi:MAG: hypothetical protein JNM94_12895 [Phycisphaerae bacterium]|nr:hypothetical protein [Phycisphaerae bacterium]
MTAAAEQDDVAKEAGAAPSRGPGSTFEEIVKEKRRRRDEAIAKLQDDARGRGQPAERAFWSMVYDFELAPMTTNRRQLEALGVEVPPAASLADDEIAIKLREIVEMLGRLHIYLLHTNHLSDRRLYERLEREILNEEVRDLPPDGNAREFIDLCIAETDEQWEEFERFYGDDASERPTFDRDSTLPRPPSGEW